MQLVTLVFLKHKWNNGTVQMRKRMNTSETTTRHRSDTGTTRHTMTRLKWNLGFQLRKFFTARLRINCSIKLVCHQFSYGTISAADYPCQLQIRVYDKRTSWSLPSCKRSATLSRVPLAVWHANSLILFTTPDTANFTAHTATKVWVCDVRITVQATKVTSVPLHQARRVPPYACMHVRMLKM